MIHIFSNHLNLSLKNWNGAVEFKIIPLAEKMWNFTFNYLHVVVKTKYRRKNSIREWPLGDFKCLLIFLETASHANVRDLNTSWIREITMDNTQKEGNKIAHIDDENPYTFKLIIFRVYCKSWSQTKHSKASIRSRIKLSLEFVNHTKSINLIRLRSNCLVGKIAMRSTQNFHMNTQGYKQKIFFDSSNLFLWHKWTLPAIISLEQSCAFMMLF